MVKKLILSLAIITAVGAAGVSATKALVSDNVNLTANTFSTGSVDLQISVDGGSNYSGTQPGFSDTVFPGQTKTKFFKLKNNGSGITQSIAGQAANISGIPSEKVTVTFTPWTSGTTAGHAEVGSNPTTHTLTDWLSSPSSLGIPNISNNGVQDYRMDVSIDATVTTASAQSIFDFVFTGTQFNPTPTITPTPSL